MRSLRPPPRVNPSLFEPLPTMAPTAAPTAAPSFREPHSKDSFEDEVRAEMRREEAFLEQMLREDFERLQEYDRYQKDHRVENRPAPEFRNSVPENYSTNGRQVRMHSLS